jgi:hypothetical protein
MKQFKFITTALLMSFFLLSSCGLGGPSEQDILKKAEVVRLNKVETEIKEAVSTKNYDKAKLLCLSLRWEYVLPGNISDGGTNEDLVILWDQKSRNYLKFMDFDPIKILGEKPRKKTLKEQMGL